VASASRRPWRAWIEEDDDEEVVGEEDDDEEVVGEEDDDEEVVGEEECGARNEPELDRDDEADELELGRCPPRVGV